MTLEGILRSDARIGYSTFFQPNFIRSRIPCFLRIALDIAVMYNNILNDRFHTFMPHGLATGRSARYQRISRSANPEEHDALSQAFDSEQHALFHDMVATASLFSPCSYEQPAATYIPAVCGASHVSSTHGGTANRSPQATTGTLCASVRLFLTAISDSVQSTGRQRSSGARWYTLAL
ncbi:hypothetical protein PENSPDRAFT_39094 [Peniophora sp. CONT]|nr:hypothetical protein PENSPDRAFT_39094 [Peniophora sp. CONT]